MGCLRLHAFFFLLASVCIEASHLARPGRLRQAELQQQRLHRRKQVLAQSAASAEKAAKFHAAQLKVRNQRRAVVQELSKPNVMPERTPEAKAEIIESTESEQRLLESAGPVAKLTVPESPAAQARAVASSSWQVRAWSDELLRWAFTGVVSAPREGFTGANTGDANSEPPNTLMPPYYFAGGSMLLWSVLVLGFAYYYSSRKDQIKSFLIAPKDKSQRPKLEVGQWAFGAFDLGELKLCCFSCCCPAVRWADTMSMAGLLTFCGAVLLFLSCSLLGHFVPVLGLVVYLGVVTTYRQKLRAQFEIPTGIATALGDCCLYFWCGPCAINQEARQLEFAEESRKPDANAAAARA
mmetsp:Transcript_49404/g.107592  ORF Transcript_49404/g.107592 Transcript_49404/m.107592 type:complete len:352 (-) Transcript_49404:128-1183(-)|eukprot:CAMPEP_0170611816 /NCGR_PEP_ID=MMETSP0224-20130122/23392_1 /TAXON_ID=285029 /ORGANISM="Togula jolla, Strain CCCM 725" /LENGTH=351 /DNA_ID=CAMNT_0010937279 /DNA_START=50 /DNA_END=1105 /DNA_ORIENTATION=+